jgi:hypothetical protein
MYRLQPVAVSLLCIGFSPQLFHFCGKAIVRSCFTSSSFQIWSLLYAISVTNVRQYLVFYHISCTVIGANLCTRDPLEVKGKEIRGVGGEADKEAFPSGSTLFLGVSVSVLVMSLVYTVYAFSFYPQASDVGKTHRFAPTTATFLNQNILNLVTREGSVPYAPRRAPPSGRP